MKTERISGDKTLGEVNGCKEDVEGIKLGIVVLRRRVKKAYGR